MAMLSTAWHFPMAPNNRLQVLFIGHILSLCGYGYIICNMVCDFTAPIAMAVIFVEGPWRGWVGAVIAQIEVHQVKVTEGVH